MFINLRKHPLRACLLVAVFLGACTTPAVEQPVPEPIKLKVMLMPYISWAPFLIAEEEGFFAEQGLEIEFYKLSATADALPALSKGDLDVAAGGVTINTLNAIARGINIKYVADRGYLDHAGCTYYAFLARRSLMEAGELDSPGQMRGRRIARTAGGVAEYFLQTQLNSAGLSIDDVELVDVPTPAKSEALGDGVLDLTLVAEPWVTRIVETGNADIWMRFEREFPDFQMGFVLFGPSILDENPDAGKRFMIAYLKAVQQYREGKTERNLAILSEATGLEETLLRDACWPAFRDGGQINVQSVLDFQAWAVEGGYVDNPLAEHEFWDPSFVEYASEILDATSQ